MFQHFFGYLVSVGFSPRLIFDIGAYEGAFTEACKVVFPAAQCWAFEPNPAKEPILRAKADRVFGQVLGASAGEVDYWMAEGAIQTGNSVLRENSNFPFHATRRACVDIDTLVPGRVPDLVKLDTQGSELAILQGGAQTICRAEIIFIETNIRRYNSKAPLFAEMFSFLTQKGFCLFDFADALRLQSTLVQADLAFINRSSRHYSEDVFMNYPG